ncbi:MAG: hypothetical protein GFH27_549375n51 [Chloroflexi bacterium AL-W]|nr:hypothetical protein [Chloroflexi bacterium AL-W]
MARKNRRENSTTAQPPEDVLSQEIAEELQATEDAKPDTGEAEAVASEDSQPTSANQTKDDNARIAELEAEIEKNRQGWQRTLAEFQNYKRRTERDQSQLHQKIKSDVLAHILPIIDDFERAMANLPDTLTDEPWLNGVRLIQGKFIKLLAENNVTAIDPTGEPFDPNQHQAIARDESDTVASGHVIETLQKGYSTGDTILRPALVRVAN